MPWLASRYSAPPSCPEPKSFGTCSFSMLTLNSSVMACFWLCSVWKQHFLWYKLNLRPWSINPVAECFDFGSGFIMKDFLYPTVGYTLRCGMTGFIAKVWICLLEMEKLVLFHELQLSFWIAGSLMLFLVLFLYLYWNLMFHISWHQIDNSAYFWISREPMNSRVYNQFQ